MAKKAAAAFASVLDQGPMRICFERIIPDELDPERSVRVSTREYKAANAKRKLKPNEVLRVARMAVVNSKKWPTGSVLKCRFLDGSAKMKKKVEAFAHEWEQHCSIRFKFVASGSAEVRISFFADAGSWSAVGRDALNQSYFPVHQPTMNYGWLRDDTPDEEYSRVVLHEFGHALASIHEHQAPKFSRVWDKAGRHEVLSGAAQLLERRRHPTQRTGKFSPQGMSFTPYDPDSIMLYAFDGRLFSDGKGPTNSNTSLSKTDIKMIKSMYT